MAENYPLHKFVYNDDILNLNRYIQLPQYKKLINQKDNHENTPLQLALMLDRRNCAQKLIDSGADTSIKNELGWSCLDEASMLGDIDLLEKLIYQKWNYEVGRCIKPGSNLDQWNELLPNFSAQLAISFRSPVPLLAKICPRDIITIYKKGSKMRIDFHIVGLDRRSIPKFLKGNMSAIINVLPNEELPIVHLLDHKTQTFQELFPNIPSWSLYDFVTQYSNATSIINFNLNMGEVKLKKRSKKIFTKSKTVRINNKTIKADVYKLTNVILSTQERLNERLIGDRPSTTITTKIIHKKKFLKNKNQNSKKVKNNKNNTNTKLKKDLKNGSENYESNGDDEEDDEEDEDDDEYDEDDDDEDDDDDDEFNSSFSSSSNNNSFNRRYSSSKTITKEESNLNLMEALNNERMPLNKKTKEQITHMLITGRDENNNPLLKKDIEFLNNHIEQYLEDIDNESVDAIYLDPPKHKGHTSSVVSLKSNSTNTLIETRSIESFNTSKFVSHSTIMLTAPTTQNHNHLSPQSQSQNQSQSQHHHQYSKLNPNTSINLSINSNITSPNSNSNSNTNINTSTNPNNNTIFNNNTIIINNNNNNSSSNNSEKVVGGSISSLVNSNPAIERIREVVSETQNSHWIKHEMSTAEYFGNQSPKGPLHMGRKLNIEYDQHIYKQKAKFYMCKCDSTDIPVSLSQFLPLLEYLLSFTVSSTKEKENLKFNLERIISDLDGKTHFPGKIEIPIMATVFAKLKFKNMNVDESKISDELFTLPQNYQPNDVFFRIIS